MKLQINLTQIKKLAEEKEDENDRFRVFLKQQDPDSIDALVHPLVAKITAAVDCTQCGNCCKSLMINVTAGEAVTLATHLGTSVDEIKHTYLEESEQGQLIINTIPCHFLSGTTCSIYEQRFNECREFPHLHKPHFTRRLFGTLTYYALCPIIFNVVEQLKDAVGYSDSGSFQKV